MSTWANVEELKNVDLPTFGLPTKPIFTRDPHSSSSEDDDTLYAALVSAI